MPYTDDQASRALLDVIGSSRWEAVGIAHGFCALQNGAPNEEAARAIYRHGSQSLKKSREIVDAFAKSGFLTQLTLREERGAAADVVPKLFPGRITEERFLELLDDLK